MKCCGPEYLRIIYGPEYLLPENLERLRARGVDGHLREKLDYEAEAPGTQIPLPDTMQSGLAHARGQGEKLR